MCSGQPYPYKGSFEWTHLWLYFSLSWAWKSLWQWRVFISWSSHQLAASSTYQHTGRKISIEFSHFFLFCSVWKAKMYLFPLSMYSTWTESMVSSPYLVILFGYTYQITSWNRFTVEVYWRGWWMSCRGTKQVALGGMELLCALLSWALVCFKSFSQFSPTWSLMLFGKSSLFFPINHLWHIIGIFLFFFPLCSRSALSHDTNACPMSSNRRSENVWKMYSFDFLICFMQEMFCYCSLTCCLINALQAHQQSLSSCFPQILFFSGK